MASGGCYSLQKSWCGRDAPSSANISCTQPAADHLDAQAASQICGTRLLSHRNPCWQEEGGNVSCLPGFFLLGEMKCGTTTLYTRLAAHPDIVAPIDKEPRYLTLPKYRHHTGSW